MVRRLRPASTTRSCPPSSTGATPESHNSRRAIARPFNVALFASADDRLMGGLPQAGVRVISAEAGDTQSVDVRLPAA